MVLGVVLRKERENMEAKDFRLWMKWLKRAEVLASVVAVLFVAGLAWVYLVMLFGGVA